MADVIRVGFIGCGRIADLQAPGYLNDPRTEIYAVCDSYSNILEKRRSEWGARVAYRDYRALLDDKNIDTVEIITPHHLHRTMVKDAAAAGKHISVQKPMGLSAKECDEMIQAAADAKVKLKVFENFVFYPPYRKAKELLDAGEIGRPLSIRLKLGGGYGGWRVPLTAWVWRLCEIDCLLYDKEPILTGDQGKKVVQFSLAAIQYQHRCTSQ